VRENPEPETPPASSAQTRARIGSAPATPTRR
jgi:hypothetical protein